MYGPLILMVLIIVMVMGMILWNKKRIIGKTLCVILKRNNTWRPVLCDTIGPEGEQFVIYNGRAYYLFTDLVRFAPFPSGWPPILQESVPSVLLDEDNGIPLDWKTLAVPDYKWRAGVVHSALRESWLRRIVYETAVAGSPLPGTKFNFKKMLPIILIIVGVIGFIVITRLNGGSLPGLPGLGG